MTLAHGQNETVSLAQARRVAAMLDIDPQACRRSVLCRAAGILPCWPAKRRVTHLRTDGFPGLGVPDATIWIARACCLVRAR